VSVGAAVVRAYCDGGADWCRDNDTSISLVKKRSIWRIDMQDGANGDALAGLNLEMAVSLSTPR
jgi:hypothetical protein